MRGLHQFLISLFFLSLSASVLPAQESGVAPRTPVKHFRLPSFAENGYTQWVLRGSEGIYESAEKILVKDMDLRIYSADERMALELSMDSPRADIHAKEKRASSDAAIRLRGANFEITGTGWDWLGDDKLVKVLSGSKVVFQQGMDGSFEAAEQGSAKTTVIYSESLLLRTSEEGYFFEFDGDVLVFSGDMEMTCQRLTAVADAPEGAGADASKVGGTKLEAVREVVALRKVVINQGERQINAEKAEFDPRAKTALLTGLPRIEVPGAYISGQSIFSQSGEILVKGGPDAGRAQMILTQTGGLGIQGASELSEQTIMLADQIRMRETEVEGENTIFFAGNVDVMSGALTLQSEQLRVFTQAKAVEVKPEDDLGTDLEVGEVHLIEAEGTVRMAQDGQTVRSDLVVFHPIDETAELTGDPMVSNGKIDVHGDRIELKPGRAIVYGSVDERVFVELPELPDLGYEPKMPGLSGEGAAGESQRRISADVEQTSTKVYSRRVEMLEDPEKTRFHFIDEVEVHATNLDMTCRRMNVVSSERAVSSEEDLGVDLIEALEDVTILQEGRVATCEKATVLPLEGKLVLEGEAMVDDVKGTVRGHRITLNQGEQRAIVEGGGPTGDGRARVTIPGFDG